MIRVAPQQEPDDFETLVRQPGQEFLDQVPNPTSKQLSNRPYWRRVGAALHTAYGGICAYSCHWIPYDTGADTVEHFRPKSTYPQDAYDWANYRLVCSTLNGRKSNYEDVLDPFKIKDAWFILEFPSLLVKPAPDLCHEIRAQVIATRKRLKLNDDESCVKARLRYVQAYCQGHITLDFLRDEAPFIAREIERQGLVDRLPEIMDPHA